MSKSKATVVVSDVSSNMSAGAKRVSRSRTFVHSEDGGKSLLGVIQGAIAVVEDADAVPELGILLGIGEEIERLLVGSIRLLEVILHEVTVACDRMRTPPRQT